MKKLFVILTMLAAMMMGAGAASATETEYVESVEHSAPNLYPLEPTDPVPGDDPTFIIVPTAPALDANGCLVVPVSSYPEYFDYSVTYTEGTAVVTAAIYPEHQRSVDLTLTDRTGATDSITFAPLAVGPGCAGALPEPAPVVTPAPAPVEVQPVPAPEPIPAGTEERVAAGEELAYTGSEDAALAGIAASVLTGGVALVWLARRMRTA